MKNKKKSHGLDLTQGSIPPLVLSFAWPFIASGLMSALYGAVDLFVIGIYMGKEVIAGVSTGTMIMNLVYTFCIGLGSGGTVLIGRKIGEKDDEGCARATGSFLTIGAIVSVLVTLLIFFTRGLLLMVLRTPEAAIPSANNYLVWTTIGVPFTLMFSVASSISRGMGNSKTPSIIGIVGGMTNVVLDFVFVGAFGMGEMGVALATSISQIVTFALIGASLMKHRFPFPFAKKHFRIHKPSVSAIFKVGIPIWFQDLLVTISFMIITAIVNDMDIVAAAAVGLISKVFSVGGTLPMAFGNAVAAMAAQNLGAGRRDRALKSLKWGIIYSLGFNVVFMTLCQIIPEAICGIFAPGEPEVILGAAAHLRSFSVDLLIIAFVFNLNAYLSSVGKSSIAMVSSLIGTFLVRVPLSFMFAGMASLGINSQLLLLGFAAPAASLPSAIICILYLYRHNKKQKALEQNSVLAV